MWFPDIPSTFKPRFYFTFWGEFVFKKIIFLLWLPYIPGSFKPKLHIPFWGEFMSKELELLPIVVIHGNIVPFWMIWKELQNLN